jgi:16S rRNA processing protein RimM
MPDTDRILLGHISGAHGIRGELVVVSHTAAPEDIAAYGPLSDESGSRTFRLKVVRVGSHGVIVRIAGITDRTAAEALRGIKLYVARAKLPKAAEREYYHADLIGLTAVATDGTPVGSVIAVQNFGAGDLIEIKLAGTTRTELLPFTDAFVPDVDLAARRVTVNAEAFGSAATAANDGDEPTAPPKSKRRGKQAKSPKIAP